ncbi:hypothetical protein [uncultured Tenacibaculum sp.]|uniref:DUF6438 domain-containing protein n=1 Tax=uncultured Tenacibaculum sp. TaxID=174713 RepID=UPI00260B99DA|nr:hypothetical protein [uncultured Tenacibaculum sp.]
MKKSILFLFIITFLINCSRSIEKKDAILNSIEIKLERGAFHYDTFILKDTLLSFYPEKLSNNALGNESELAKYYQKSEQYISKTQLMNLIQKIETSNIWNLSENYSCESSCTSNLTVHIKYKEQQKTITCEDYKCDCPELLQYLENELIKLHGKDLKRIDLPG